MTFAQVFLCFLILLCIQLFPTIARTYHNISLGSSLTASDDNSSWLSPSGDFAFGFQRIGTKGYLLSIWFNNIPEKTIVWFPKPGNLVQKGSRIELTNTGQFLLRDNQGQETWNAFTGKVSYASMLDNGNFVLINEGSVIIWESFGAPTDTILPTQKLSRGNLLVSSQRETSYSTRRFWLQLNTDGNLGLYMINLPTGLSYEPYWETMTFQTGFEMVFDQSGYIYLTQKNGSRLITFTPPNVTSTVASNFYHRATLDYDGVLRQYVYPKTYDKTNGTLSKPWSTVWLAPENICLINQQVYGSGVCGYNSYCRQDENQRPGCECPPGYSYIDPSNKFGGCKPNFVLQSCSAGSQESSLCDLKDLLQTDFPGHDYETFSPVDEDWCRETCLNDCLCAVAFFIDLKCSKKGFPFANGRMGSGTQGKILVKVRKDNYSHHSDTGLTNVHTSTRISNIQLLLGSSVAINFIFVSATILFTLWRHHKRSQKVLPYMVDVNVHTFTYKELVLATDCFKEELGRGASGRVYKAVLAAGPRNIVAVKKLEERVMEGEKEFLAEVKAIGQTNHKNLVKLIGFCNEGKHRLLVYEFMSNGSLASFLFGSLRPKWCERIQVACGIARGLTYLHEECSTRVIHCDIKPQNILLDDSFTARISDFGLAKLLRSNQIQTTTAGIRGTTGYVAPEWFMMNITITEKVDVYSFGIMLFEIICCRKNFESKLMDENKAILSDWAFDCYVEGRFDMLVENDQEAIDDIKKVEKLVMIALWCIQEDPSLRPIMSQVTQMLEGVIDVTVPPNPYSNSIPG